MSTIQIQVFAVLKEYFETEFEQDVLILTIEGVKQEMENVNPGAKKILQACRFAVNGNFVTYDYTLKENDKVVVIPPSSGG